MIEYDQEPADKKKKRKKKKSNPWLVPGIVAGALLVIGGVVVVVVMNLPPAGAGNDAQAKGKEAPMQPQAVPPQGAGGGDGGGRMKPNPNPKGLVQNVRATAFRVERQNEMKNIGQFFVLFVNDFNRNPKTLEEFAQYMQRDLPKVAEAIKDKYYVLNLKASIRDGGVIAYEELLDAGKHLAVRTDGSVHLLAPDELQKLLMPP